jgi:chromosome partitioning protein
MRIVSVINYKGGVGKTTLTANLGAELARRGNRVLLVDLDPQSSLTFSFYQPDQLAQQTGPNRDIRSWYETFVDGVPQRNLAEFVVIPAQVNDRVREYGGFLGLVPSSLRLIDMDLNMLTNAGLGVLPVDVEVYRLRRALADALRYPGLAQYDFVLIDCPPNFNIVTQGAIVASDHLLIPARPDYLSSLGIDSLTTALGRFAETYNNQVHQYSPRPQHDVIAPKPLGVVFTMVQYRSLQPIGDHHYFMERVRRSVRSAPVFRASIRENIAFGGRGNTGGLPVILRGNIVQKYYIELMELATEFLSHFEAEGLGAGRRAVA